MIQQIADAATFIKYLLSKHQTFCWLFALLKIDQEQSINVKLFILNHSTGHHCHQYYRHHHNNLARFPCLYGRCQRKGIKLLRKGTSVTSIGVIWWTWQCYGVYLNQEKHWNCSKHYTIQHIYTKQLYYIIEFHSIRKKQTKRKLLCLLIFHKIVYHKTVWQYQQQ